MTKKMLTCNEEDAITT